METVNSELIALAQVIVIDLVLAGDNAIVVGLAASRVAPELRAKVIFWGIAGAVVLGIVRIRTIVIRFSQIPVQFNRACVFHNCFVILLCV